MMRLQAALSAGLAACLLAPARLGDEASLRRLESALGETVRALEVLTGLRERAASALPADLLQAVTEAPAFDARAADERLQGLRREIGLLQMELDALEGVPGAAGVASTLGPRLPDASGPAGAPTEPLDPLAPAELAAAPGGALPAVTTGLDDDVRRLIDELRRPADAAPNARPATATARALPPEGEGYSADPLLEARACLFAGRYERGLELLAPLGEEPGALYWRARLLERLGRAGEAIAALERVVALGGDEPLARRAGTDLEFLRWKRAFEQRLPAAGGAR